jgi:hypothetical protein
MENLQLNDFERLKKLADEKFTACHEKKPEVYRENLRAAYCIAFIDGYLQRDAELLVQLNQK